MTLRFGCLMVMVLASGVAFASAQKPAQVCPAQGAVQLRAQNGLFHVTDDVVLTVIRMDACMLPKPGQTVSLDEKNSFVLQIRSGETHLRSSDLTSLLNGYLLPHAKTPIKNVSINFAGGRIEVKGDVTKGVDVPFEAKGTVSVAGSSDVRVHFTELKVAGFLSKGLLDALGIKLSKVAQPETVSRFRIEGDDILLPIAALFPPPRIAGRLTAVRIEGDSLVQIFGSVNARLSPPPTVARSYIYFRGGRMRFGKLTMDDVDLELVSTDPTQNLDFSLDHYSEQLQDGYSKTLPSRGLLVYMPNYAAVEAHRKRHSQ